MTTYLGFDVLEVDPDSSGGRGGDAASQEQNVVSSPVGVVATTYREKAPRLERSYRWACQGPAEVQALRDFLDARHGRAVPFWMLSWQRDFSFSTFPGGIATWVIKWCGYSANLFPGTGARRHIFVRHPVSGFRYGKIVSAVDNGDGTETLTLGSVLGVNILTTVWTPGFLRLCRLASDTTRIEWTGQGFAAADLRFIEIPNEAPL